MTSPKYPGIRAAMDGNTAVIMCEREATDAAGAYPITPSTQMGEYWAEETARGHLNISERPLIFVEPEGEHAAAAVTAGLSMTGLRAANFSSGQGIAYMHESLYAAVGKRLTYVLNIGARAMTKATLNVHAGHDDYHCIDDTGFFQLFAKNAQHAADLNLIAHRIAELSLTPGAIAQDGFLTTHLIESLRVPERALVQEYLGRPDDLIDTPTAAQKILWGEQRRRIPILWDVDDPVMAGLVQNQDAYMQSVAAQRPFFFEHVRELADRAFREYEALTGRHYAPALGYRLEDADYVIVGQGSVIPSAEVVADYLRKTRRIKVGVVDLVMFRPFPADVLGAMLRGRKGVAVLERLDQPLAVDPPLAREIRAAIGKCVENGRDRKHQPHPGLPAYKSLDDVPPIYSGSFGMGSRDLQPEGLIAAVENMLPDGARRPFFYLSIDFQKKAAGHPKLQLHQDDIARGYPEVAKLAIRGSENPNLMPEGSITVRFHSIGGWGAITTGKNLAMTLFDLLGYHIKANPKYGSEKKGQPTTYYLSAAPTPIRINCEYFYVDVVLSPDPNVFGHTNALAGLRDGGTFIIQSDRSPEDTWAQVPPMVQKEIADRKIAFWCLDAFRIAREEATDPELQLRMQGNAFQGAFFAAAHVAESKGLSEAELLRAIEGQLKEKFGGKGQRVVDDNVRVVKRGFDEVRRVPVGAIGDAVRKAPPLPAALKLLPASGHKISDVHRFWEQTGSFYARGEGSDQITDPFIGLGTMPALSATFRDMTGIRFQHPQWIPENCTACGDCYTVCPDTAIPGLVGEPGTILDTAVQRLRRAGRPVDHLPRAIRQVEQHWRAALDASDGKDDVHYLLDGAIARVVSGAAEDDRGAVQAELAGLRAELAELQMAITRPHWTLAEKQQKGTGGLFLLNVNPTTCKGCMECVTVCGDDALRSVTQTKQTVEKLRRSWEFYTDLPTTPSRYIRISNLDEGAGTLTALLLDKQHYGAMASGDGACLGCSEKTVIHLFTATVEALMQPRVEAHVAKLDDLIGRLEAHVQKRLMEGMDVTASMGRMQAGHDVTLADLAAGQQRPIDQAWLRRTTDIVARLKDLRWRYTDGTSRRGRAAMGILNATGCSSVWGSTYPFNPYPYPWANHLFQDAPSLAMGVFEGHMAKMADGFKAIRKAELELAGGYRPAEHDAELTYFNWRHFSDEEWALCPPVVAVGGDGAMYDIGFQNLSRALMSGKPIKVLVLDTQVYSNTGGQACTSGFVGQISDMAQYGKAFQGKEEARKEIGLIGMAHRTSYVLQSTIAHPSHMIEGFVEGLNARRPALFNLYTSCQPEHGIADDVGRDQAKLAVESRAYPLFKYNPARGPLPQDAFDLSGNPDPDQPWPTYGLKYVEGGRERTMQVPLTFADFAMTEARFRKHFRKAPRDTWNDKMVPIAEFLTSDDREGRFPFVWTAERDGTLGRLVVDSTMVRACEERQDFWRMLKAIARAYEDTAPQEDVEARIRKEVVARIVGGLLSLAGDSGLPLLDAAPAEAAPAPSGGDYQAPWIDSPQCTACDECIKINNRMFAYNADKKAFVRDASAGTYAELVKAAERCTAGVIHPGLPLLRDAAAEKLIARAQAFN